MEEVGLALAAMLLSSCGWLNRKLIFVPSRVVATDPRSAGLAYEDASITSGGHRLGAWHIPAGAQAPVVLLCHGNGGNIGSRVDKAGLIHAAGAAVLLFDYRGYGRSEGLPSEEGTYEDAEAAYRWLRQDKGLPPDRIVIYGESLGAAVAVELALRQPSAGLVIDSGFTSTLDMGRKVLPFLPVSWLVRYRYDSLAKIGSVRVPVLVMHSPEDDIVPYQMGRKLFEAARQPKRFVELSGDHNSGYRRSSSYPKALREFLADITPTS